MLIVTSGAVGIGRQRLKVHNTAFLCNYVEMASEASYSFIHLCYRNKL